MDVFRLERGSLKYMHDCMTPTWVGAFHLKDFIYLAFIASNNSTMVI